MDYLKTNPSSSREGVNYKLFWTGVGYYCTCPGFGFSKKGNKTCRHADEWRAEHGDPEPIKTRSAEEIDAFFKKISADAWAYVKGRANV